MSVRVLASLALLFTMGVPSRAQEPPPPPAKPRTGPRAPQRVDSAVRRLELAYVRRKFQEARGWYADGRFQLVIKRCTAILDMEPGLAWRAEVRALRLTAKEKAQAADVLEARLIPNSPHVMLGDVIHVRVRLTARATDPVEWKLAAPDSQPGAHAVCDVQVREHGLGRIQAFETFRVPIIGLPDEATLPNGDSMEGRIDIPTHDYAPLRPTARTYRLIATIRPQRLVAGDRAAHRQVLAPTTEVAIWPRGAERLATDPVMSMRVALREEWPFRTAVTAFITTDAHRAQVAEVLLDSIGGGFERSTMWPAVYGALRRVTGEDLPDTRNAWLGYWSRIRKTPPKKD